uniref:Fibroblast growth factor-binding protein 2 n=1 Tax=Xenopus tropicalis TaxID=8364 RepID=F6WHS4_XENTR
MNLTFVSVAQKPDSVAVFFIGTLAQNPESGERLPFQTKAKDACVMSPTGQGEIRLKIECKNQGKSYTCEFAGKPSYCRAYNRDKKGFWKKLSEDLSKVTNPCDAQVIKHSLCPKAPSQSQLRQVHGSPQSDTSKAESNAQAPQKTTTKKPPVTKKPAAPKKLVEEPENPKAMKIAKERCWWYFQKFCSYMIEIFIS